MYVIFCRLVDGKVGLFAGVENHLVVLTNTTSKAMVFETSLEVHLMCAFLEAYCMNVEVIDYSPVDDIAEEFSVSYHMNIMFI